MTTTKFKGTPVHIDGEFIRAGAQAPDFELVKGDLSPLKLSDLIIGISKIPLPNNRLSRCSLEISTKI